MSRKILVLNSGSSSIKYRLFDFGADERVLASGLVERIGEAPRADNPRPVADHRTAIRGIVHDLEASGNLVDADDLWAIGHRIVHGGEAYSAAARVDEAVLSAIRDAIPLAPLHNPPNLVGVQICRELWPTVPQVAVFDTAFHQTMPPEAYRYALPEACYRDFRIRRYGFHGTSFDYVTGRVAAHLQRERENLNLIVLHLGNGASAAAIRGGRSIDTSMGLTPLAGLVMGTRSGDIDPGVLLHLLEERGLEVEAVGRLLNKDSGLKGLAGSNDIRDVLALGESGDDAARLALAIYAHRLKHYIGAYLAILGPVDALVFTGGIGEHAAPVRRDACAGLEHLGLVLDSARNDAPGKGVAEIHAAASPIRILVVPTDEELEIARQTAALVAAPSDAAA